ncbi:aldehyde dehydrogenase family protein [Kribbella sp. NPDC059898]|uniref:aldehyde dehydrogenase family protein n=1 Tax=Kribbella sp. NPDC059898 TaxID=3346995 RepID=UPI003666A183
MPTTTAGITPRVDSARLTALAARVHAADPDDCQDVTNAMTGEVRHRHQGDEAVPAIEYSGDMGSLVSQKQLDTVTRHVDDAVAKGATVLAGGKARPDLGPYFYEPTILADVDETMEAYAHETFGPLVSLYRVADEEEAIAKSNDSEYGLNFSIWTSDESRGYRVAAQLEAGTVNVNDAYAAAWGSMDAPMGGMKASGLGRRHGEHGILKYTESQTIAIERLIPVGAPDGMNPKTYARIASHALRLAKRLPGVK